MTAFAEKEGDRATELILKVLKVRICLAKHSGYTLYNQEMDEEIVSHNPNRTVVEIAHNTIIKDGM
jgi:hypothetical protein